MSGAVLDFLWEPALHFLQTLHPVSFLITPIIRNAFFAGFFGILKFAHFRQGGFPSRIKGLSPQWVIGRLRRCVGPASVSISQTRFL